MEFVAIDVETANADMSSICQVGIAKFKDNKLIGEWCSLIDPEDYFESINIYINGITKKKILMVPLKLMRPPKKYTDFSAAH